MSAVLPSVPTSPVQLVKHISCKAEDTQQSEMQILALNEKYTPSYRDLLPFKGLQFSRNPIKREEKHYLDSAGYFIHSVTSPLLIRLKWGVGRET